MTRDEVRELIVKAIDESTQLIDFGDFTVCETDFDAASEAVLAAFAARGIVLGDPLTNDSLTYEDIDELCFMVDGDPDTFDGMQEALAGRGFALVRVVQ